MADADASSRTTPARKPTFTSERASSPDAGSLVPPGGRFAGVVAFRGEARIDGSHQGSVCGEGLLTVGVSGEVIGTVDVDELVAAGRIEGEVRVRRRVELQRGATVGGTLESPRLVIAEGALLDARCQTGGDAEIAAEKRRSGLFSFSPDATSAPAEEGGPVVNEGCQSLEKA